MKWDEQILCESDIQKIYLDLINEYGLKLPPQEREVARSVFQDLYNQGRSWEWIYWAVWQLGERKVINNKGLLFYKDYQREIDSITKYAREYHFRNLTLEQYMEDYVQYLALYEENSMEKELFERLVYFDNKYWNTEEEFTEEEMGELIYYYKEMLKDLLRTTRAEYEMEQKSIASELRRVFGRIVDVEPHTYVDSSLYHTKPTEEKLRQGIEIGFYRE